MSKPSPVEVLVATIPRDGSLADIFVNAKWAFDVQEGVPGAFGGALVGQSVTAAASTVPTDYHIYSIQSSFLRSADGKKRVSYRVDRVADSRAFATRVVRTTSGAGDNNVYVGVLSFYKNSPPARNVLAYGVSPPDVGDSRTDDISEDKIQEMMSAAVTRDVPLLQLSAREEPFDWRPLESTPAVAPIHFRQRSFVRSPVCASTSPSVHLAALSYLSDTFLLGAALSANPAMVGPKLRNEAMGVSRNHNLSLHDPTARVDDWMLGERNTSWGADGRVLIHQRFWNGRTGRLVMSGTQEGLIRLKNAHLSKADSFQRYM